MKSTRTLLRGLEVLELIAFSKEPLGPTRVAGLIGLDKATAGRLLFTLAEAGYIRSDHNGSYRPTGKILSLSTQIRLQPDLRDIAHEHLIALRDITEETVHLGIIQDLQVMYIDKVEGTHSIRLMSAIGQMMPIHTTSLGKAALAWMKDTHNREEILSSLVFEPRTPRSIKGIDELREELTKTRERGFAIDDEENEEQAACVGAAVLDANHEVVGMISVSGPSYRVMDKLDSLGLECVRAAAKVTSHLSGSLIAWRE